MSPFLPLEAYLRKNGFRFVAGIDEVGRGPLAGPVVSAVVILKENARIKGLKDSKLLSLKKREALFPIILKNALDYAICAVPHTFIDKFNILRAVQIANKMCLETLKLKPDFVLIDGRDRQLIDLPFQNIIRGDKLIRSIAAASVIAKVFRDRIMIRYAKEFAEYGFERHMGYGTREHRNILKKIGACEIHRKSYNFKA